MRFSTFRTSILFVLALSFLMTVSIPSIIFAIPPSFAPAGPPETHPPDGRPPTPTDLPLPPQAVGPNPPAHGLNQPPVANHDAFTIMEDERGGLLTISAPGVLANDIDPDGDTLTALKVGGSERVSVVPDGAVRIFMELDYNGTLEIVYDACDPSGLCSRALADIVITPVDDPPDPESDTFWLLAGNTIEFSDADLFANDEEVDGDQLTLLTDIFGETQEGGTITTADSGFLEYTPPPGFVGDDYKSYQVCDLINDQPENCRSTFIKFEVRALSVDGWIAVPVSPDCQAFLPAAPDSGGSSNATLDAYPGVLFETWTATDFNTGSQYGPDNPVPGGVYIGDLSFTCIYSLPYNLTLWNNVRDHFFQQTTQANEFIDAIYGNTTSVHPIAWQTGTQTDLFAGWELSSPNSPLSSLLLRQKFRITMVAVDDPGYPEVPDALRNAMRITVTDGGKQVLRDVLVEIGLLAEEERFEFPGRPTQTAD